MLGSRLLLGLMLLETLAALVNWCGSTSTCDFVCDCWDCSDENQCGYENKLGPLGTLFTCDFEGTSCGWEDISTTVFRWSPTLASISSWSTKPPFDHTLGIDGGWFMSTTDQKVKPFTTAQLRSPVMREAAATCEIRAWYHLSGTGLITTHHPALSLELSFGNTTITVWRSALTSSHPWRELVAYTGRIPGTFQVTFSATQNFSQTLQLALDDVEFRNCGRPRTQTCGLAEHLCQQGGCVTPDRWCDGTEDCWDGEDEMASNCILYSACSFEEGWCRWEPLPNQTLSWINSSSLLGPPPHDWPTRDHTTNSQAGFFVYLNHQLQVGKAWMVSPALRTSKNGSCHLVFYLHLRSSGSLNIYSWTEGTLKLLQSRSGDLGDYWFREKVDFHLAETFQIVLEGTVIAGHPGSIALDDLILSPGCLVQSDNISAFLPLELDAPQGPCGQDEFTCQDGKGCIGSDLVCDFKADCTDISDEADCGATTSTTSTGGWTDLSVGRLKWTVQNASGQLRSGGISLALQEGPGQMLSMARAATPAMGPSSLACVVEMNTTIPQGFLALAVADISLGTCHWVWYALGNASAMWVHARVPLGARARPFQLELMGLEELSSVGETPRLRVHNITFMNCDVNATFPKSAGLSCNFETDWCAWYVEQNDGFEWERSTGAGWGQDHTTSTGSFLFVDPSAFGASGLSTRLLSSPQTATEAHTCLSFWYRMEGPQIGTLSLLAQFPGEPEQLLWTQTSSSGSVWHLAFSTLSHRPGQSFQVIFEAFRNGFLGLMALDDISMTPGSCGNQTQCSFEVDECGLWVKDGPAWTWQNGNRGSGPSVDHTLGTPQGHYFLLNTSGSALPAGRKATLNSGIFPPGLHTHCMMFWYYLSSSGPASLHVYVEEASWQRKVSMVHLMPGEAWRYANTSIRVQEDWQVALVVEGGDKGPNSYLALDDLHILEGTCSEPGSCDFERSPCSWSKPPGAWYGWDWKEAATPSQSPSPKEDHTLANEAGHYAYVDVALLGLGSQAARLASEPLPSTVGSCLRFHYHMDFAGQSSQAELQVKLSSLQGEQTLWQATGPQSQSWEKQNLLVSSLTEFQERGRLLVVLIQHINTFMTSQIVLEAKSGAWPSSETIAVDDISYAAEQGCEEAPGTQDPEPGSGSGHRHSDAGLVASIVCFLLLVVAVALIATYCLKKRSTSGERLETEHTTVQGFDNVTFRDDIVIIPSLPIDREAE